VETAADSGADYINLSDHILGVDPSQQAEGWDRAWMLPASLRQPYTHADRWHEPLVTIAFIAALAEFEFLTSVLVLPQRNTALVAKQAAQLDLLCNGKLRLGVGVGWNAAEFASVGAPFHERGRRFREQVTLLRRFWTEDVVTFKGEFHSVLAAGIAPPPVQRPIPIWIGGANVARGVEPVAGLLQRIGEIGDGWCTNTGTQPDENIQSAMRIIRTAAEGHGRNPAALGLDARLSVRSIGEHGIAAQAAAWSALGATHVNLDLAGVAAPGSGEYAGVAKKLVSMARAASGNA
jgi:probable F420-dependent oxidoreductase